MSQKKEKKNEKTRDTKRGKCTWKKGERGNQIEVSLSFKECNRDSNKGGNREGKLV